MKLDRKTLPVTGDDLLFLAADGTEFLRVRRDGLFMQDRKIVLTDRPLAVDILAACKEKTEVADPTSAFTPTADNFRAWLLT